MLVLQLGVKRGTAMQALESFLVSNEIQAVHLWHVVKGCFSWDVIWRLSDSSGRWRNAWYWSTGIYVILVLVPSLIYSKDIWLIIKTFHIMDSHEFIRYIPQSKVSKQKSSLATFETFTRLFLKYKYKSKIPQDKETFQIFIASFLKKKIERKSNLKVSVIKILLIKHVRLLTKIIYS